MNWSYLIAFITLRRLIFLRQQLASTRSRCCFIYDCQSQHKSCSSKWLHFVSFGIVSQCMCVTVWVFEAESTTNLNRLRGTGYIWSGGAATGETVIRYSRVKIKYLDEVHLVKISIDERVLLLREETDCSPFDFSVVFLDYFSAWVEVPSVCNLCVGSLRLCPVHWWMWRIRH